MACKGCVTMLAAGWLAALVAPACAQDALKLAIGQHGNWESSVPELGQRMGFFRKHGLTLELLYTQGSGETIQAAIAGSVDIGVAIGTPAALGAFGKGAPIRAIANHTTGAPAAFWYVPAGSAIKSLKDTDGKTVAYSTTGSSNHTALLQLVQQLGVAPKLVATGSPAGTFTQAMSGQIDVGWSSPPFGLEAAEQGKIRIVGRASDVPHLRDQTVRLQITNAYVYEKKKDQLDRYVKAYDETLDWMYADPAALKMYSDYVKIPETITRRIKDEFYPKDTLAADRLAGVDALMQEAITFKYLSAPLSKAQLKEFFVYSKAFD